MREEMKKDGCNISKLIRFNQASYEALIHRAAMANLNPSAYIRTLLLSPEKDNVSREQLNSLLKEINYIGHNINQITKNHNAGFFSAAEKEKLDTSMKALRELLISYIERIEDG